MARVTLLALGPVARHRGRSAGPAEPRAVPQALRLGAGTPRRPLAATVRKAACLGSHVEYELALGGIEREIFVMDGEVARPHPAGTGVAVTIDHPAQQSFHRRRTALMIDLDARADFALDIALRAGRLALAMRHSLAPIDAKSAIDFCTEADLAVERLIRGEVAARFGDSFIGEEFGGEAVGDAVWVVDPIDGTAGYIHGTSRWCVSIAFVVRGVTEIGVIYAPTSDRLFAARRGGGARMNGRPIQVSGLRHGAAPVVELGWSERRPLNAYCELLRRLNTARWEFRRLGSGALGLAEVAQGLSDAYVELHMSSWDALAGLLLVAEAGGHANNFLDRDGLHKGNLVLGATPEIAENLAAMVADLA